MQTDQNYQTDWNSSYDAAEAYWSTFLTEAKRDLACFLGDQWNVAEKAYLEKARRSALVFNKVRRVVKLVEGYQRKNRLSLKIDPVEGSDEQTSSQLSGVVQWQMQHMLGYNVMSDAFSGGALKTGINLVNLYMDYSQDPLSGDLKVKRVPYNKFMIDPNFSARDLSDCDFICRREYLNEDAMMSILPPDARKEARGIRPQGISDVKYTDSPEIYAYQGSLDLYRYDEYWKRTYREVKVLIDMQTGQMKEWVKGDEQLRYLIGMAPDRFKLYTHIKKSVEQAILIEDKLVHVGDEPLGLEDYPFVPVMGFFDPEFDQASRKLQGIVRCIRDPQTEVNRRRSKMLDIIDSQISSGWKAKEDSVVNPTSLYVSGQGTVVWVKKTGQLTDIEKITAPDIPQGMFRMSDSLDKDILEIPGANAELFGMGSEKGDGHVAAITVKMRQGAGLTVLQDIFDNYRLAKKLLGQKLVKAIQVNYHPTKIQRILNEQPSKEFYNQEFGKYDCVPEEGVLSDTQRQMAFAQLLSLKEAGAPIPWAAIIDAAPLENKEDLKKFSEQAEQQQAKSAQKQEQMADLQMMMLKTKIGEIGAEEEREKASAIENMSDAKYKQAKTMAEINDMGWSRFLELMNLMQTQKQITYQRNQQGGQQ